MINVNNSDISPAQEIILDNLYVLYQVHTQHFRRNVEFFSERA